jgi:hypothetical protein
MSGAIAPVSALTQVAAKSKSLAASDKSTPEVADKMYNGKPSMLDAEQAYKCAFPYRSGGHAVRRMDSQR